LWMHGHKAPISWSIPPLLRGTGSTCWGMLTSDTMIARNGLARHNSCGSFHRRSKAHRKLARLSLRTCRMQPSIQDKTADHAML
jgi:hypothetical protein